MSGTKRASIIFYSLFGSPMFLFFTDYQVSFNIQHLSSDFIGEEVFQKDNRQDENSIQWSTGCGSSRNGNGSDLNIRLICIVC